MKKHLTPQKIVLAIVVAILVFAVYPHLTTSTTNATLGSEDFTLEVADSSAARERGLSGRSGLAPNTGMIFVFELLGRYSFWMKDMNFPIDIIWLRDDWCIVHIVANADPESYPTTFAPPVPARYVIEIGAGEAARVGLKNGSCIEALEL